MGGCVIRNKVRVISVEAPPPRAPGDPSPPILTTLDKQSFFDLHDNVRAMKGSKQVKVAPRWFAWEGRRIYKRGDRIRPAHRGTGSGRSGSICSGAGRSSRRRARRSTRSLAKAGRRISRPLARQRLPGQPRRVRPPGVLVCRPGAKSNQKERHFIGAARRPGGRQEQGDRHFRPDFRAASSACRRRPQCDCGPLQRTCKARSPKQHRCQYRNQQAELKGLAM